MDLVGLLLNDIEGRGEVCVREEDDTEVENGVQSHGQGVEAARLAVNAYDTQYRPGVCSYVLFDCGVQQRECVYDSF